jgi:hypothetical protein
MTTDAADADTAAQHLRAIGLTPNVLLGICAALGSPTQVETADGEQLDERDVPMLLGAVVAAAEIAALRARALTGAHPRSWAAGWHGVAGSAEPGCGARRAFGLIHARLATTEWLMEGFQHTGEAYTAAGAAIKAASALSGAADTIGRLRGPAPATADDQLARELLRAGMAALDDAKAALAPLWAHAIEVGDPGFG